MSSRRKSTHARQGPSAVATAAQKTAWVPRPAHHAPAPPHQRRNTIVICTILILLVFVAFWPALNNDFINYDDTTYITENFTVQKGLNANSLHWAFTATEASNWHPLTWLSHMLDCELYGHESAAGHHLTNLVLHAANAVLVFLLLAIATGSTWRSAIVAALFAVHPLRVESVAWVSERKDVLSLFFGLLTLLAYVRYARAPTKTAYAVTILLFMMALLSKPMMVTLPCLLLLFDWWPLKRWGSGTPHAWSPKVLRQLLIEKIPFLLLTVASCAATYAAQSHGGALRRDEIFSFAVRLGNAALATATYLKQTLWPADLAVFYPHPGYVEAAPVIVALTVLVAISAVAGLVARKNPAVAVGWLWFLGTLVPVSGIVQVGLQSHADRYTYLPHIGLFFAAVWGLHAILFGKSRIRIAGAALIIPLLIVCVIASNRQTRLWRNSSTLFAHALSVTENNFTAHINFGNTLKDSGQLNEAAKHYREALAIQPNAYMATGNLGLIYMEQKDYKNAIAMFEKVLQAKPRDFRAYNALGNAYLELKQFNKSVDQYKQGLRIYPNHPALLQNLANAQQAAASQPPR